MKKTFDTEKKFYTLSLLVKDIPGVLSQVARLFSRKGYNIESIVSGETSQPGLTRITIVILPFSSSNKVTNLLPMMAPAA